MSTLLERIDAERWRVQDLRTKLTIAKAFQDELDERAHGRILEYANSTVLEMVSDHRYALVARVAGWVRAVAAHGGLFEKIAAGHLTEIRLRDALDADEDVRRLVMSHRASRFATRFPHVADGALPTRADIEHLRDDLLHEAAPILENSDAIGLSIGTPGSTAPALASLADLRLVVDAAEALINDLSVWAGGPQFGFSKHLAHPDPEAVAGDLVDLAMIGTIDNLLSVTGVNEQLGKSGAWWWQYRQEFWEALDQAAKDAPDEAINAPKLVHAALAHVTNRPLTTPQIERVVGRYRLEYARYDATARSVEDKVRRILGRERVKALISSRAKDPDSCAENSRESEQSTTSQGSKTILGPW